MAKRKTNETVTKLQEKASELEQLLIGDSVLPSIKEADVDIKPKELLFIHYYLSGNAESKAAHMAGYTKQHGYNLIKKQHIQEEIEKRRAAQAMARVTQKETLMAELFVIFHQLKDTRSDMVLKMKVIDMIAKLQNYYSPDTQINVQNQINSIKIEIVKPQSERQALDITHES